MDPDPGRIDRPPREKVFNAPLLALLIALSMPALYFFQEQAPDQWLDLAFAPTDMANGRWLGLFTSMLLHGGWAHALMNAVGALTFGAPVARGLPGPSGTLAVLALYITAGVVGALGYGLVHFDSDQLMVGASGAVFGLIGAATRLLGGRGRVLALTDRGVMSSSIAWMGVNAVVGLIGFAPGAEGARIAWEAHAFGFVTGLLLIGPVVGVFGRPPSAFDSADGLGDPRA